MRSDDVEVMRAMSPNRRTTPSITKPTAREGHGGTDRGDAACKDSGSWTDWPRMSSASPPRPGSRGWCASTGATSPSWPSRLELANAIFEYLEIFHNRQRRHSSIGMLSPIEYERRHADNTARDRAS